MQQPWQSLPELNEPSRRHHCHARLAPDSTVLFADIVGFTEASNRHQPAELLALLNRIFGAFDALVARHGVEKIKTIGDAYMVAGGLPQEQPGHAVAIAALALDMMDEVAAHRWPDGSPLRLRIGINSGPLSPASSARAASSTISGAIR